MSDVDAAKGRLNDALERLDKVTADKAQALGAVAQARVSEIETELSALKDQLSELQSENTKLKADLAIAQSDYAALEEVADAVGNRLDAAIGNIRTTIEH